MGSDRQSDMDARVERAARAHYGTAFVAELGSPRRAQGVAQRGAMAHALDAADVPDLLAERDRLRGLLLDLTELAEDAHGHHGIERCAGPTESNTEWDDIQDEFERLARQARTALQASDDSPAMAARAERPGDTNRPKEGR